MAKTISGVVFGLIAASLSAATYNGTNTISTVLNEANGATYVGNSGTGNLTTVSATGGLTNSASLNVGYNSPWDTQDYHGRLVFDGGVYNADVYDGRKTMNIGYGGMGWLTINGGSVYLGQCVTTSKVVQTGGTIHWHGRGTTYVPFFLGHQYAQTLGMYIVSGGTTTFGHHVNLGGAAGKGHFEVRGSAGTIWAGSTTNRWYTFEGQSTMAFVLDDSPGHISCIDIYHQATGTGWGATIDLALDGYTPKTGDVFDLVRDLDGSINIDKWILAAEDQEDWMLQRNAAGDTMQAVYIKEPVVPGGTVVLVQ